VRLATKTRYGVRAVFDIAYHGQANTAQAKDIAERQDIPLRYLEQIFQDLRKAGLVDSKRGPRGGYTLRRDPSELTLGAIVRALQGPIEELFIVEDEPGNGGRRPLAVTVDLWKDLATHVAQWFDAVTVLDLVKRAEQQGLPRAGRNQPMYFI
jgi:Rrf2 family transcriptional regulator, iron-sulfur cluster assembly transcription factor